jgi:hypothetical protein
MGAFIAILAVAILAMMGTATYNSPEGRAAVDRQLHELVVLDANNRLQSEFQAQLKSNKTTAAQFNKRIKDAGQCPSYQCVSSCDQCAGPKCKCITDGSCGIFGMNYRCQPQ